MEYFLHIKYAIISVMGRKEDRDGYQFVNTQRSSINGGELVRSVYDHPANPLVYTHAVFVPDGSEACRVRRAESPRSGDHGRAVTMHLLQNKIILFLEAAVNSDIQRLSVVYDQNYNCFDFGNWRGSSQAPSSDAWLRLPSSVLTLNDIGDTYERNHCDNLLNRHWGINLRDLSQNPYVYENILEAPIELGTSTDLFTTRGKLYTD